MKALRQNHHETLAVPDSDTCGTTLATFDVTGWVTIGSLGSNESILIGRNDWPGFVEFVSQLDKHMRNNHVGPYTVGR